MLSIKIASLKNFEKEFVLVLDEMFLTEGMNFNVASKLFIGNVTLLEHEGITNHSLVLILGGMSICWNQTVTYYFTSDSVKGSALKPIIHSIISKAEAISLRVNSITSDMGACNTVMWTSYGIGCSLLGNINNSVLHPCDSERKLYFLPDVSHLPI